jgi:hypothetical protein
MAQHSRKPMPPKRSLPPLSFGDPELDNLIANDNHPSAPPGSVPPPRSSLSGLTFGSVPPPQRETAPAPEPAPEPAPTPSPARSIDAILGAIPSIPPAAAEDPSFTQAKDPSFASAPPPPPAAVAPPPPVAPPWHVTARERFHAQVDVVVERLPELPAALHRVPAPVASAIALVALWFQLGGAVRGLRAFLRLLAELFG